MTEIGYLRLDGIQGECSDPRFRGCIVISALQMMQENLVRGRGATGSSMFRKLFCLGPQENSGPRIFQMYASQRTIKSAKLTWLRGNTTVLRLSLKDVLVDNFQTGSQGDGNMSFVLSFGKVEEFQEMAPMPANDRVRGIVFQRLRG